MLCQPAHVQRLEDLRPVTPLRIASLQVYILGRMGNTPQALRLIVEQLADIPQAIAFVQTQDDEELWQLLISLALGSAATAGVPQPSCPA